ncbi:MAG: extracellular solute-binding protein [Treponema sp.]|jgi:putative aldouronate transport system substrate-binding protein|nr:extracellular solute-binding protein [Treponema sp.]
MKKAFLVLLVLAVSGSAVFAGGRKSSGGEPVKTATFLFFGDKTDRMSEFVANDMPEYLKKKGLNISVDLQVLPWSEGNARDVRLASGEDFTSFIEVETMSQYYAKGYLADATDYIAQYGKNLTREVDQSSFDSFKINGRSYAIPYGNKPNASEFFAVCVRQDLLEKVGMKEIKTLEDLERFAVAGLKLDPAYIGYGGQGSLTGFGAFRMMSRIVSDKNIRFLTNFLFTDESAKDARVFSYFESEEFKKYAAIARRWNQLGIISPQQMSDPLMAWSKMLAGQGLFYDGVAGRVWENLPSVRAAVPTAKLKNYFIGDAKGRPLVSRGTYSTAFFIPANAKYPEAYVQVLDACYESQESFDFFTYGMQGKDFQLNSAGKLTSRTNTQVFYNDWASNIAKWLRYESFVDDDVIQDYINWDKGAILQKDIGFVFDLEPVKVEDAQLNNVLLEYMTPIAWGFVDYDTAWPEAQRRLKDAGIDRYVAEFQRQFSAWYAANK